MTPTPRTKIATLEGLDALLAEVERLREAYNHRTAECKRWQAEQGRLIFEANEARQQVADLRAGIAVRADAATSILNRVERVRGASDWLSSLRQAVGALVALAEPGGQVGEGGPCRCESHEEGCVKDLSPAPVVPDSTDVLHKQVSATILDHLKPPKFSGGSWTINPDEAATAVLAALGLTVTDEGVGS